MALDETSVMAVVRAARPSFKNKHDKVAFVVHASFIASGYLLTSVGYSALYESAFSSTSSEEVSVQGWNAMDIVYAFVYHNPKNSIKVLVRCITVNQKLLIHAIKDRVVSEPIHVEINVDDECAPRENESSNYEYHYRNFSGLMESLESKLFIKLRDKRAALDRRRDYEYTDDDDDNSRNNRGSYSHGAFSRTQLTICPSYMVRGGGRY